MIALLSPPETNNAKTFQIAEFEAEELSGQQNQKLSRVSGNFPDCSQTFKSAQKLQEFFWNFPVCSETFYSVHNLYAKFSNLSRKFPERTEIFQIFQSAQNFPGRPETSMSNCKFKKKIVICCHIFYVPTQKLSGLLKLSIKQCLNAREVFQPRHEQYGK